LATKAYQNNYKPNKNPKPKRKKKKKIIPIQTLFQNGYKPKK
jgi:hypothetical protein